MIEALDLRVFSALEGMRSYPLDGFFAAVTALGNEGLIWIALAVVLLIFRGTRRCGLALALSLVLCLLFNNLLLKNLVARPRPFTAYPQFYALIAEPDGYSFPSGHTASSVAAVCTLWIALRSGRTMGTRRVWLCAGGTLLAFLIAFSRVYLRVHYASDVLGGALSGAVCAAAAAWLLLVIERFHSAHRQIFIDKRK